MDKKNPFFKKFPFLKFSFPKVRVFSSLVFQKFDLSKGWSLNSL